MKKPRRSKSKRNVTRIGPAGILALSFAISPVFPEDAVKSPPIKIAVFDFELDDVSPAASLVDRTTSSTTIMDEVSKQARQELAHSGRYRIIDASKVTAKTVTAKPASRCSSGPTSLLSGL